MGAKNQSVLCAVSGREAVEILFKCMFIGLWQFLQFAVRRLWKGHRRKNLKSPPIELTVDSSIGIHCYIKLMGVKYHYVETGPKNGSIVLILGDAPDAGNLWVPSWASVVRRLAESGYHVVTLDLRGTGGSEGGNRKDLSPPRAVEELSALLKALGVSSNKPAAVIGFGIGGMLTWYLAHCRGALIRKLVIIGAPHPNMYWQHPPVAFCNRALQFIQWPYFPERWLAEGILQDGDSTSSSSRARDWTGALNYVRGAAWWRVRDDHKVEAPALLLGARSSAAQLVGSAQHCSRPALRLLTDPGPADKDLPGLVLDFLVGEPVDSTTAKVSMSSPRWLVGRVLGAVAGRGRDLTARLSLPALSAQA
ncbi:epoxide hydrolase 4-like [Battus philenor]|uniref:epoxide hydrolase 4-like n=1 Tax=Battus philenor TaxID=42288 RepID=UPI0035CF8315